MRNGGRRWMRNGWEEMDEEMDEEWMGGDG